MLGVVGISQRRVDLLLVERRPQLVHGVVVDRRELRDLVAIVDHDELPRLRVPATRRPDGRIEDAGDDGFGDRIGLDAPHRTRRVEDLAGVHDAPFG